MFKKPTCVPADATGIPQQQHYLIRTVPTRSVESQRVRLRGSTIAARPTPWPTPATAAAPESKTPPAMVRTDPCVLCCDGDDEGCILLCDCKCNRAFHASCVGVVGNVEGDWLCHGCARPAGVRKRSRTRRAARSV